MDAVIGVSLTDIWSCTKLGVCFVELFIKEMRMMEFTFIGRKSL